MAYRKSGMLFLAYLFIEILTIANFFIVWYNNCVKLYLMGGLCEKSQKDF